MKYSKPEVAQRLKGLDYAEHQIEDTVDKLFAMNSDLIEGFEYWLDSGEFLSTPEFSGYTPTMIAEQYALKPPAVFLLLQWIYEDPQASVMALTTDDMIRYKLKK